MATYYHGNSEMQGGGGGDGLQTLILMNPSYVGYSDNTQQPPQQQPPGGSNFVFINSNNQGNNSLNFPHPPPTQTQQFVGIPLSASASASPAAAAPPSQDHPHDISALHGFMPRVQYMYNPNIDLTAAREVPRSQQGLSLSLSPQQPVVYAAFRPERDVPSQPLVSTISTAPTGDDVRASGGSPSSASGVSNGVNGMQSVLLSSKYLKAARELLDEVVNVGKVVKNGGESVKAANLQSKSIGESSVAASSAAGDGQNGREGGVKRAAELTTAERQEIQIKKAKLVNMLDEVEQRYRQYHHQMQIVISWFEQAAGIGSAKTYTALALQTISKQFRCLKDAILSQIRAASKSLGEEDSFTGKMEGSRLKFVDNQLRQQRALQQLGMIQHNAWRPQRGLPERSVSVLRAWLFEHFLHPYPKDSDKIMLAKQTGLTRSQVSNWFINARVRLWKPMVEEMYTEEMKEHEKNAPEEKTSKSEPDEDSSSKTTPSQEKSPGFENPGKSFMPRTNNANGQNITPQISMSTNASTSPTGINLQNQASFSLIASSELESISHGSPKKPRSNELLHSPTSAPSINMDPKINSAHMLMKFGNEKQSADGFTLMGGPTNFIGGFGSYTMGELGRFGGPYSGNGVSLTLGLPHCENLSMPGNHRTFLPNQSMQLGRGVEIEPNNFSNMNTPTSNHSANVYENMNIQNRKPFAAPLLPDFVA